MKGKQFHICSSVCLRRKSNHFDLFALLRHFCVEILRLFLCLSESESPVCSPVCPASPRLWNCPPDGAGGKSLILRFMWQGNAHSLLGDQLGEHFVTKEIVGHLPLLFIVYFKVSWLNHPFPPRTLWPRHTIRDFSSPQCQPNQNKLYSRGKFVDMVCWTVG